MKTFNEFIAEEEKSLPKIYLDMDETLVDWMSGANLALKKAGKPSWNDSYWDKFSDKESNDQKWEILNKTRNFWESLKFTPDGIKIWNFTKKYKPNILSACGTEAKTCKKGKMNWLQKNLGLKNLSNIHLVRRNQKKDYAKSLSGKSNILIDDYEKNCKEFKNSGGIAIKVTNSNDVINKLKKLGFR